MKRVDSTIAEDRRPLLARALADAIPEGLRRWTGEAAPQARVEELRARFAAVWDAYMAEVSERTQAQRWIASEALAASVCGYLAAPAEEEGWDEEEATIEAQQTLELIMGAEISMSALGGLPKLTPGALYTADVLAEWLRWIGAWQPPGQENG
jgi:hypothetical protein